MKKLLSILTISTLATSVPAPLLANTVQTRVKRYITTLTSNSNNDYLPLKENNDVEKSTTISVNKNKKEPRWKPKEMSTARGFG